MSPNVLLPVAGFLSAAVTLVVAVNGRRHSLPTATNYRGRRLPVVLGAGVTAGIVVGSLAALWADLDKGGLLPSIRGTFQLVVAVTMVFVAGLFDDAQPERVRGLRSHARALARGRVTSGLVKLAAIVVASAILVEGTRGLSLEGVVGVLFVAGSANLWNLFDVAPGRSIKLFLLAGLALQVAVALLSPCATCGFTVFVVTAMAAALIALPFDLRELAMLGDGGANVLGFVLGGGLFLRLSTPWLWVGLGVVVVLTVVAETVTLTRVIRAFPPLRWLDDAGRIRREEHQAADA